MTLKELQNFIKEKLHVEIFILETEDLAKSNEIMRRGRDGIVVYENNKDHWMTFYRERGVVNEDTRKTFATENEVCLYLLEHAESESKNCQHFCKKDNEKWYICYHRNGVITTGKEEFDSQDKAYQFSCKESELINCQTDFKK